jgi:acyl carrier protein
MRVVAEKELIDLVVGWVKKNGLNGSSHTEICESTNLLESGLLDSFAFVDLVLFIENYTGKKLDLIDVDPEEFTVVESLCHLALQNGH